MGEVLAGFVCGYALSLLATPVIAIAMLRARLSSELMQHLAPEGTSLIAVSIIIHTFAILTLTAVGIVLGMILAGMEGKRPAGGLGSPNAAFTTFVIAATTIALVPIGVAVPRWRPPLLLGGLVFAGMFGWAMPYLSLVTNANH